MASVESLQKILSEVHSIYIDTNILIYHLEDSLPYSEFTQVVFDAIEGRKIKGHTSALSILELNVKPYELSRPDRTLTHIALLKNLPNFSIHPLTIEIADTAARLRAKYKLKTPDAIHLASALECQCEAMIGNDKDLRRVKEVRYLWLESFIFHTLPP